MDDPTADYAIIPTWFLARRARQDVKVVLSGEGGDEIFGGYGRYRSAMRPWWLGGRVMRGRGSFDRLDVLRAPPGRLARRHRRGGGAGGGRRAHAAGGRAGDGLRRLAAARPAAETRPLPDGARRGGPHAAARPRHRGGRVPAAGRAEGAAAGRGKWLLRQWLARHLPAAAAVRPKQGFTVPIGAWIAAEGARLGPLVAAQPGVAEIAEPARVEALFRHIGRLARGVRRLDAAVLRAVAPTPTCSGLPCEGDVFEMLAER